MNVHQMTRSLERRARQQHGVVSLEQLAAIGFSRQMVSYRVGSGQFIRLAPKVYALAGFPSTWLRQYKAAELSVPDSRIGGLAAGKLHSLQGFGVVRPELLIHYTANHRTRLATVHRSDSALSTVVDGIRVTTLAQTLCDVLPRVEVHRWERACDGVLLEGRMSIDELQERRLTYGSSRRSGIGLLRALVAERLAAGWAPSESELERLLREAVALVPGCPSVQWQPPAPWAPGGQRVDGLIPDWRLVLEADGRRWHSRVKDFDADRWRDNQAAALGLRVMRFTHPHLTHRMDEVVALIAAAGRASNALAA